MSGWLSIKMLLSEDCWEESLLVETLSGANSSDIISDTYEFNFWKMTDYLVSKGWLESMHNINAKSH